MEHAKCKNFWDDPMIGRRAAAFVDRLPGRFFYPRSWSLGIPRKVVDNWRKGELPLMKDLFKLAAKGADLNYIVTGRRIYG